MQLKTKYYLKKVKTFILLLASQVGASAEILSPKIPNVNTKDSSRTHQGVSLKVIHFVMSDGEGLIQTSYYADLKPAL